MVTGVTLSLTGIAVSNGVVSVTPSVHYMKPNGMIQCSTMKKHLQARPIAIMTNW